MIWLIGYIVSVPLLYVAMRAIARWRANGEVVWTVGDRLAAFVLALLPPFAILDIAFMIGDKLRRCIDWDKEVKW